MKIEVLSNARAVQRALSRLERKQLPFATAVALTRTAQQSQAHAKQEMGRKFKLRNKYSQRGVRIKAAKKSEWPKPVAGVGIDKKRAYIAEHERGTVRRGIRGHRRAVPTENIRRTKTGKVPARLKARALRAARGAALGKGKGKGGGAFVPKGSSTIFQRQGRGRRKKLVPMHTLVRSVRIKSNPWFRKAVVNGVQRRYRANFQHELRKAVRSAKPSKAVRP